jgi:hypothetical protein
MEISLGHIHKNYQIQLPPAAQVPLVSHGFEVSPAGRRLGSGHRSAATRSATISVT